MSRFLLLFVLAALTAGLEPCGALTPMDYYQSLVAGADEDGFQDGGFSLARFNNPSGLAFDATGRQLYVADRDNQRIRVVDLDQDNRVKTLAGTGAVGSQDGPLFKATFNAPSLLAAIPNHRLALFDAGSGRIRILDLQSQTVSTLAKGVTIWNMIYLPQDDCLYFSEPDNKKIEKLNMKSLAITDVVSGQSQLSSPGALCLFQDHLCVADTRLPTIYEVSANPASASVSLFPVGKAKDILALASSDGILYALEKGDQLVKVGLTGPATIQFPTPWGFLLKNGEHEGAMSLFHLQEENPVGFLSSPSEPRKLYLSTQHSILSVRDYDFEKWWSAFKDNGHHLTDFDYPAPKPPRTFRILAIGTSRNSTSVFLPPDLKAGIDENIETPRVLTFSKRLELLLNTEATLQNSKVHFEVLNLTHRGEPMSTYGYYEVPDFVKKYDIDLVIGLADQTGYIDYFERPMTSEGIPAHSLDYEYMFKPLSQRANSDVAKNLLERCKALKIPLSDKQDYPGDGTWSLFCNGDSQMQRDLREMTGRRLQLLDQKLKNMKTSGGNRPGLVFYYVPGGALPNDCGGPFWREVCAQFRLSFLDLSEPFNALKTSYAPVYFDHFTAYGNELVALLLGHYLVEDKFIPF